MTKKEITEIIESKAAEYGFEIEENSMGCIEIETKAWSAARKSGVFA